MAVTLNESSWTLITEVQESPSELGGKVFNRVYGKIKTRYGAAHNVTLISFEWRVGILYNSSGGVYNSYTRAHSFTMTNPVVNEPYSGNWAFGGRYYTNGAETVKASWEKAVYHDDNGQYSHTMTMTFGGWNNENRTATQTVNLPAYSRYSTLSVGNYNLGSAVTATVTQQASGFSSIVYYRYPGLSSTWAELGRATGSTSLSISGTPSNVVSQITNSTTVTAEFKVRTYFANNYSGDYLETSPTITVTASVPSSYKPTLTLAAVTEGNSAISTAFGSGTFVNGYSKLNAKGTFGASAGSTPISYTFTYNGIDNNITSTATTYTFQFTPVSGVGTVYGKVTDSRGRVSSQVNKTFTAYDYTPPTIQIRATRGTYSGDTFTADIFGTAVRVEAKWTCSSVNSKNAAQSIVVNDGTADRATYTPSSLSANDWTVIANIKNVTYATTSQYTFTAQISDKLKSATATATIGTSSMPLSLYHQSGNVGAAVGQMASSAESGKFNVYLPTNLKWQTYITETDTGKAALVVNNNNQGIQALFGDRSASNTNKRIEVATNGGRFSLRAENTGRGGLYSDTDSLWLLYRYSATMLYMYYNGFAMGRAADDAQKYIQIGNANSTGRNDLILSNTNRVARFYALGTGEWGLYDSTEGNYLLVKNADNKPMVNLTRKTRYTNADDILPTLMGTVTMGLADTTTQTNFPTASQYWHVVAIAGYNTNHVKQFAFLAGNNTRVFSRSRQTNSSGVAEWSAWQLIAGTAAEVTGVITRTGGTSGSTCNYAAVRQDGRTITLYAKFTSSSSTSAGSNIFEGTLSSAYRPPYDVEGYAYYGSYPIGIRIQPSGVVTVRRGGSTGNISDSVFFSLTYII